MENMTEKEEHTEEWAEEWDAALALGRFRERQSMACQLMTACQKDTIAEALYHCDDQKTINRLYANFKDIISPEGAPEF
jgi:hypothetical protein